MGDLSKLPKDFYVKNMAFTKNTYQDVYPSIYPTNPELSLAGKIAIISGASRGIGAKIAVASFAKAEVKGLVLLATNGEKLAAVEREVKQANPSTQTLSIALDVSDTKSVDAAFEKIKAAFGHANVLVNTAAVVSGDGPGLKDVDPELWWRNFEVNGKGSFLLTRAFLRLLPSKETPASIINLSSWQAFYVVPAMSGYFISKFIIDQLMTYVATEHPNVTAVALHPGLVLTDLLREPFRSLFSLDSAELVGGTVLWLCQDKAKFMSGRFTAANWSVDDLLERKDEIVKNNLLKLRLGGQFAIDDA